MACDCAITQLLLLRIDLILWHGGEVGGQLLADGQELAMMLLRLQRLAHDGQHNRQIVVALGQFVAVFGHGGELAASLSPMASAWR